MIRPTRRSRLHKWIAAFLSVWTALGPIASPAYAALTQLADEPLNVRNASKPNIVLTVDDSTSMLSDFLPDYVVKAYCRDGTGKMSTVCGEPGQANDFSSAGYGKFVTPGFVSQQWKIPYGTYNSTYDNSGPGAGCDLGSFPPKCSPGIDPTAGGAYPAGMERYPSSSPKSNALYEYWTLWPAPVHNSAFNHLYYNPAITYDPPLNADGTSFAAMNAAGTNNWTRVPVDPWATTKVYVDLTAQVMVGQWCNSDWTQGTNPATGQPYATDPAFCRSNGQVAPASSGAPAAIGDYMYPWFPTGITAGNSPNMALSIANSKAFSNGPSSAFLNSADPKYFYENDNVIWCNTTSPLWPQGGSTRPQVCNGVQSQTCQGSQNQTCGGGTAQTCSAQGQTCQGVTPQSCGNMNPQTCNGSRTQSCNNVRPQTCNGAYQDSCVAMHGQTCNGYTTQTCNGFITQACGANQNVCNGARAQTCGANQNTCAGARPQVCNGAQPQSCGANQNVCNGVQGQTCQGAQAQSCGNMQNQNCVGSQNQSCNGVHNQNCVNTQHQTCSAQAQTCQGAQPQNCNNINAQTCNGAQTQTCTAQNQTCQNITGQTCNGYQTQVCNMNNQTCNNVQTQSCVNMHPGTQGCTWQYDPPGCNLCGGGSECGTCSLIQVCPLVGNCSVQTGTACYSNGDCPVVAGTCSSTGNSCTSASQCAQVGTCSISQASCSSNAQCPAIMGHCSTDNAQCSSSAQCQAAGTCSVQGNVCYSNANCPVVAGHCSVQTGTSCTANSQCATIPGSCSVDHNTCTTNAQCAAAGSCSVQGNICYSNANCPTVAGNCSIQTATACTSNAQCGTIPGTCSIDGNSCSNAGQCPDAGHCSFVGNVCYQDNNCPTQAGTCSVTNATCTANSQCPTLAGACSIDNTSCTANSQCNNVGRCTVQNNLCYSNANCPTVAGHCSIQSGTACTQNSQCSTLAGSCSVTGNSCFGNSDCTAASYCNISNAVCFGTCPTIPGTCSVQGNSCTSNANCPTLAGGCTVTGGACSTNSDCPAASYCNLSGAVCTGSCPTLPGTCSVTNSSCTSNTDCTPASYCTQTNAVCTSNAQCPTLPGNCSSTGASCTSNAACPAIMGHCSTDNNTCSSDSQCANIGICNVLGNACYSNANCGTVPGTCSVQGNTCTSNAQCPTLAGSCSVQGNTCMQNSDCPTLSGICSVLGNSCTADSQCVSTGTCTATGSVCTSNAQCPTQAGHCSIQTGTACLANSDCGVVAGTCNLTGQSCTSATQCPIVNQVCSIDHQSCTNNAQCAIVPGQCSVTASSCTSNAQCGLAPGTCSVSGAACTSDAQCPTLTSGSSNATCSDILSDGSKSLLADALSNGVVCRVNNRDYANIGASRFNYPDQTYNFPVTGGLGVQTIWVDDALPAGARALADGGDAWTWVTSGPAPKSGTKSHQSNSIVITSPGGSIPNAGFESPSVGTGGTAYAYGPAGATWTFGGGGGFAGNASGFTAGNNNAPQGTQVLFLQNSASYAQQVVSLGAGTYNISYNGAQRRNFQSGTQAVALKIDGTTVDTWTPPNTAAYALHTTSSFTVSAGNHTIRLEGVGSGGTDYTAFVDSVTLNVVASMNAEHQHYFDSATATLQINTGDLLFAWVYLDPSNPPTEIMLQWGDNAQGWNYRAYWGDNSLPWGTDATQSRRYMGPLPPTGTWVQLIVPASMVGLEGHTINAMAFSLWGGKATWDAAGKAASAVTGGGDPLNACMPTPRFAMVPRHYWKTSVEWCDKAIATAGDKWAGYGTASGGSCQSFKDSTHIYPRFYKYGAVAGTDNYSQAAFERVDLDISQRSSQTFTHTYRDATNTPQTITRTWDDEMTNYANWFAYYRTRIQAVKTVTSLVFNLLDDTYRVGFHTLTNVPTSSFVNIGDFTPSQKALWWAQLFGINIRLNVETPTLDAMARVGEYYKNGSSGELSGATDPIVLSCQKNWHMLFTDGFTNQPRVPTTTVGNTDQTVPTLPQNVLGLTPGQPWPPLYRENTNGAANSVSDYATYYWSIDLRGSGAAATDNVPTSDLDPASWQHQNFAAMSLGTEGKLPAGNQSVTEDQIKAGAVTWPQVYPNVYRPDESGVDDLWHAAINGRGRFVNAQTTDELKLGMGQILADITNQAGSRAGVGFQNVNLSASNNYIYRVRFEPGWGGSLTKVQIDPTTGNEIGEIWRAADQLTQQLLVVPGVKDTPWFTERKIVTTDTGNHHVPFLWANLAAAQQQSLSNSTNKSQAILEFLRGNRSNEGAKVGNFRVRPSPLGDIVDSQAVYVGPPKAPYMDGNDPAYSTFKSTFANRAARVYVAANDGMVHAFDEQTGNESWAYVPLGAYNLANPLVTSRTLGALSYQDGGLPAFHHHFYVDATPRAVDVDFNAGGGNWHSVLVGGLGKGGKSYYAIDVSDPAAFTNETETAKRILWEFTDADMGYTYGRPLITKTHASAWAGAGDKWVAILPAGYNNATGEGKIFFVDVATGSLLLTMGTGFGDANNPSGLAHIAGYTMDYRNYMTEQVYAGDLSGNLWRFDISDSNISKWKVEKIASLTDPGGQPQPVTTPPQIEVDVTNGVDRWVFVGTGKLYAQSDLADTQTQTMYAIRDGSNTAPNRSGNVLKRSDLALVSDAKGLATKPDNGWYDDLPLGQRIVVPPQAALSVVTYSATSPQNDPCLTGQPANVYAREYGRGNSLLTDLNGTAVETYYSPEGGVGLELLALDSSASTSDVPNIVVGLTLGTTGKLKPINIVPPAFFASHRMSWRLLSE